ncbi:MAG: PBP1A family penicillin-binding protein, partial [Elusimicrobiota bacterium]
PIFSNLVLGGLGENFPTQVYSAPSVITNQTFISRHQLLERLKRLRYLPTNAKILNLGEFRDDNDSIEIYLKGFQNPTYNQIPQLVKINFSTDQMGTITDEKRAVIESCLLEPELITELSGPEKIRREPTNWEEIPLNLSHAVIAAEDKRFYTHWGIDVKAIARAALVNIKSGSKIQGGSTITQQLAKNLFLTQKRTFSRKIAEAWLALYIDLRLTKEKILTLYLNQIYMGQDGFISVAGIKSAAHHYFSKELKDLTLSECAILAGLIRSPFRYNPIEQPLKAKLRRDNVLKAMLKENLISQTDFEKALAEGIEIHLGRSEKNTTSEFDFFSAEVVRNLLPRYREEMLFRYGLKIYTTVDPVLQSLASITAQTSPLENAIVSLDIETGKVLALVGGKDFKKSQFNRATQAKRQPGSVFKPFVYGAALEQGMTPASIVQDRLRAYRDQNKKIWAPQNFDRVYHGSVTIRQALTYSYNASTLDIAEKIGIDTFIKFAKRCGIKSPITPNLASALGASETNLLEITAAYAPFANGGMRVEPYLVTSIADYEGQTIEINSPIRSEALDQNIAFILSSMLESVIKTGTGKSLKTFGWTTPTAGKTGTTNKGKDAWFIAYTKKQITGVWVGDDHAKALQLSGASHALPLWAHFMTKAFQDYPHENFSEPSGIVRLKVDPTTGEKARSGCPETKDEVFIKGTEPSNFCSTHSGGLKGWFKKLFRKIPKKPSNQLETDEAG